MELLPDAAAREAQHYASLLQLLAIDAATELWPALTQASSLIARTLDADLVDVFLYQGSSESLIKAGAAETPPIRRRASGLDRLVLAHGGLTVQVFLDGGCYRTGDLDREPHERQDIVEALGVRSAMLCRIQTDHTPWGVLQVSSARRAYFSAADARFLKGAAHWMGLVAGRADLVRLLADAVGPDARVQSTTDLERLTPREREVAVLIASGLSNEQIAARLVVVKGTVAHHIDHILRNLNFTNRVQIAVWVVQRGLLQLEADEPA